MKSETNLYLIRVVLPPDLFVQGNHRHQLSDVLCQHSAKDNDIITSLSIIIIIITFVFRLPVYSLQQLLVHEVELCEVVVGELLLHLGNVGEVARADLVFSLQLRIPAHTSTLKIYTMSMLLPGYQSKLTLTGRLDSLLTLSSSRPCQTLMACLF